MKQSVKAPDIYAQVTQDIIRDLEAGHLPWECPWNAGECFPRNAHTKEFYSGINVLILWSQARRKQYRSARWLTFKQAQALGGSVRRGEKATTAVFFKKIEIDEMKSDGEVEKKQIPMLRTYALFNLDQCEGIETAAAAAPIANEFESCPAADSLIESSQAQVFYDGGSHAFYDMKADSIHLPRHDQFKDQLGFYSTILHELTHWTGHASRLKREFPESRKESQYAREELVAELGSSFLCAKLGLPYTTQHAAYVDSWLSVLKSDKTAIFKAAARAREASDFLTPKTPA